jgi:hypothetical protein
VITNLLSDALFSFTVSGTWNVHYRVQKSPPVVHAFVSIQTKLSLSPCFFKIHVNILLSMLGYYKRFYAYLASFMRASCLANPILHVLIILIIIDEV